MVRYLRPARRRQSGNETRYTDDYIHAGAGRSQLRATKIPVPPGSTRRVGVVPLLPGRGPAESVMPGTGPAGNQPPDAVLLEGALVATQDDGSTTGRLGVAVADGRIAAVDAVEDLRRRYPRAERIDCSGRLLMPGMVNAHLHPELQVLKGAVEELNLHDWEDAHHFDQALALLSSPEGEWIQRASVRAALADCLLGGTTAVACYGVTTGADETAASELRALRMRGSVTVRDVEFRETPECGVPRFYRLHAEEALTVAELEAAAGAHGRGERLVMHAAETEHRISLVRERFGTTTIRLLQRYGLLSPRMLLSHAIHVDEEERELIRARGARVVSSPVAEMKLSDGVGPILDYVESGVTVALGTDSAVCNNANDLFLEMRQLGLSQKLRYGADAMRADQIVRMATRDGAAVLDGDFGAIVPGLAADLILIDTANPRLQPLVHRTDFSNVAANLVYSATGQDVTDVMVGGRWVVRARRLLTADADAIWDELTRAAAALYSRIL